MLVISGIRLQSKPLIKNSQTPITKIHSQPQIDTISFGRALTADKLTQLSRRQCELLSELSGVHLKAYEDPKLSKVTSFITSDNRDYLPTEYNTICTNTFGGLINRFNKLMRGSEERVDDFIAKAYDCIILSYNSSPLKMLRRGEFGLNIEQVSDGRVVFRVGTQEGSSQLKLHFENMPKKFKEKIDAELRDKGSFKAKAQDGREFLVTSNEEAIIIEQTNVI